jgi:hypothetical protein
VRISHRALGEIKPIDSLIPKLELRGQLSVKMRNRVSFYSRFAMTIRLLSILLLAQCFERSALTQVLTLSGTVRDAVTNSPLPAANIRVLGTTKGTVANSMGVYRLALEKDHFTIVYSFIGYRSDTLHISLEQSTEYSPRLQPSAIQMSEVLVTNEDPAIAIMREVIRRKKEWGANLQSYEFDAFTRLVMRFDTAIAAITESYSTGYWRQGDTLREVIRQQRKTENLSTGVRVAVGGFIVNFYEDDINFGGFRFVGPTSPEAFDYYDFKLEKTRQRDEIPVYTIGVTPRSRITPLFRGKLDVIGDTYALIAVDVSPNEAYTIPFVSRFDLRYKQQFGFYENRYWMPMDIGLSGIIEIGFAGLTLPRITVDQASVIYDFKINRQLPDSIFKRARRIEFSNADKFDSVFWAQHDVIPLTQEEQKAYKVLDSTQTLDKQFKPSGPLAGLSSGLFNILSYGRIRYDRAEGLFLGLKGSRDSVVGGATFFGSAGYGFSDRRGKFSLGVARNFNGSRNYRFELEGYRGFSNIPDEEYYDPLVIVLAAVINKSDYRDYFYANGWRGTFVARPLSRLSLQLEYRNEDQRLAAITTDFSIFERRKSFRPIPPIAEGTMRGIKAVLRYGDEAVPLGLVTQNSAEIEVEHSNPGFLASSFDFTRMIFRGEARITTFASRLLFPPTLNIKLAAGTSIGTLPPQRFFSLESRYDGVGPFGVLRTGDVKEFAGDRFVSLSVEHNFRSTPFLLLDIPFLYRNSIELILHGTVAQTWSSSTLPFSKTTNGWYSEAGIGFNRLISFFRLDGSYRFIQPRGFFLTFGVAQIF